MKTRSLGRAGLRVPALCLGTMTFGLQTNESDSFEILDRLDLSTLQPRREHAYECGASHRFQLYAALDASRLLVVG